MPSPISVPNRIQQYRKSRGLTQHELARKVGISRQTLAGIEKGTVSPTLHLMIQIALALGVALLALWALSDVGKGGESE